MFGLVDEFDFKTLKDHGFKNSQVVKLKVRYLTTGTQKSTVCGFQNKKYRFIVIYKSTDYSTLTHELGHSLGILGNNGFKDVDGKKETMTYNYWWLRDENNLKSTNPR